MFIPKSMDTTNCRCNPFTAIREALAEIEGRVSTLEGLIVTTDEALDADSTNPVQNKAIVAGLALKADTEDLDEKQDVLISGQNILTVNGASLLGSGNMTIGSAQSLTIITTEP